MLSLPSHTQLPFLPVRQSYRHAVSGQRCVRSAPAAPLLGYDGTPGGRPILGEDARTHTLKNTHRLMKTSRLC